MNFNFNNSYSTTRLPVFARNVVSTSHPLAAQAGLSIVGADAHAERSLTELRWPPRAVLVLGNVVVLVLEAMVVSIQTTRLVLCEFVTRFMQGRGRAFRPLPAPKP